MVVGQVVPEGLAAMSPGPELACLLAGIDPARVANDDIVDVLTARSRQLAHDQAHLFTALTEVTLRLPFAGPGEIARATHPERYGADEVRAALAWTRRAAEHETDLAHTLVTALPRVHAALLAGHIDRPKAAVFARHLDDLTPAQITAVCDAVLPQAPRLTTGQITDRIKRLICELDPAYYERRYRKAVRDRMVVAYLTEDGTAVLSATGLPADEAAAAWERLDALARTARRDGHPATLDQIRADLVLGLLDGTLHGLNRNEILQALLERFAGHADTDSGSSSDSDPEEPASTLARVEDHDHDAGTGDGTGNGDGDGDGDGTGPDPRHAESTPPDDAQADPEPLPESRTGTAADPDATPAPTHPVEPTQPVPGEDHRVGAEIRVPLSTLLELDERPGELPGWGPVPAHTARRTVTRQRRAPWRWVVVDDTGHLLAEGITRRRPTNLPRHGPRGGIVEIQIPASLLTDLAATPENHGPWAGVIADIAAQFRAHDHDSAMTHLDAHPRDRFPRAALRRHTQVRDRTCVHPGCRTPARRADTDHTLDHHDSGTTTQDDLAPICRHDHMLKTEGGWRLDQPRPGRFVWRSPLGRTYPVDPEPILPPPPAPVTRDRDPSFDDPARETDQDVNLRPRDRAPLEEQTERAPAPDAEDDVPPPFK